MGLDDDPYVPEIVVVRPFVELKIIDVIEKDKEFPTHSFAEHLGSSRHLLLADHLIPLLLIGAPDTLPGQPPMVKIRKYLK